MKKFLVVIMILAASVFGFQGTSKALVGVPDAVPGTDILLPFFLASMPGFGNDNTLITITEVEGIATGIFWWVNDIDSVVQCDDNTNLTPNDVLVTDALTILSTCSAAALTALEIDLDGDGNNDHWAGYIHYFNDDLLGPWPSNLISHAYQVSLPDGSAAAFIPPSMEWDNAADPRQTGMFGDEAFSANALWVGKNLLAGLGAPVADATFFRLMPRFFVNDAASENLLFVWTDSVFSGVPLPGLLHVNFWDEDENAISGNIPIDNELNILDLEDFIPAGLFVVFPHAGWIDIATPDLFGNGWFTDVNIVGGDGIWDGAQRYWLGYSYQRAIGAAAETWNVIHEAHRETDDL